MKVPVLFIIFNRPETEITVFNRIREYQPEKLYVAADGPRASKDGEAERCEAARAIIKDVDWPCEVKTLFRDHNLGCGLGVSSAISWFFEQEEYGCIIEDDVLPSLDFFEFCEEALPLYQNEEKVMLVSSFNPISKITESSTSGFSIYSNIWGWASWKRAWSHFDLEMKGPRNTPLGKWMQFYGPILGLYLYRSCKLLYRSFLETGNWHTWDCQWNFTLFQQKGLALVPYVNLTRNVGIGVGDGTHYNTSSQDPHANVIIGKLTKPYVFPEKQVSDKILSGWVFRQVIIRERLFGLKSKISRLFKR